MKKAIRQLQIEQFDNSQQFFIFSICSDSPYLRYEESVGEYNEILKISDESIDWSRLKSGACAFLKDHNPEEQIGVIKKSWIQGNKIKCAVQFSSKPEIKYLIEDIKKGIRSNTSIGYQIKKYHWDEVDGKKAMIVDEFMIYEASLVSIPADPSVGYKRNLDMKENQSMKKSCQEQVKQEAIEQENKPVEEAEIKAEEVAEQKPEGKPAEQPVKQEEKAEEITEDKDQEVAPEEIESEEEEIKAAGELANEEELAEECIKGKKSLADFKNLLKQKRSLKTNNKIKEKQSMEKFSISKAIRNACSQYKKDISEEYETKVIADNKRKLNVGEQADIVLTQKELNRALANTATHGAELVKTDYLPQEFTPVSRPHLTLEQTGFYTIPVEGNAVTFAVVTSGATAAMYDLDGELTAGEMLFANRTLTPHKAGVCIPIPYSLLLQARPEIDAIVQDDMVKALEEIRDKQILIGNGTSGEVTGITNTTGINTLSAAASALYTWDGVLSMEKKIRDANEFGGLCFVMNSTDYKKFASTLKDETNSYDGWILEDDKIKGYPVYVNNNLANGQIILGDFTQLIVADFDGLMIKVDDITYIRKQAVQIVASRAFDVCVRKPAAFCVSTLA